MSAVLKFRKLVSFFFLNFIITNKPFILNCSNWCIRIRITRSDFMSHLFQFLFSKLFTINVESHSEPVKEFTYRNHTNSNSETNKTTKGSCYGIDGISAQTSLSSFTQEYLCKSEDTYFMLQNKYLYIYEDT